MDTINNAFDSTDISEAESEIFTEEERIPTTHKLRFIILTSIIGMVVMGGIIYGSYHFYNFAQSTENTSSLTSRNSNLPQDAITTQNETNNSDQEKTAAQTSAASPKPSLKPSSKPSPSITPKPSLQPTATPVTFDLSTNNSTTTLRRYYNSGDGRGYVEQAPSSYANDGPVFKQLNQLWETRVELCTKIRVTNTIYGYNINYLPSLDGKDQSQQLVGSVDIPANQDHEVCARLTNADTGQHKFQIKFNPYKNYPESNYLNNTVEANYTVQIDNEPPTFVIYGPNSKPEGICFHVNDVSDNISSFFDIVFTYKFDNSEYAKLTEFACFASKDNNSHTITIKAVDKQGNSTENSRTFTAN